MYAATRIFTSNLTEKMAQRFFNLVLLPRVRDDIAEYKKLNFHLYQALRKALFKPGAFFKGFLLPLCEVVQAKFQTIILFLPSVLRNPEWHLHFKRSHNCGLRHFAMLHSCLTLCCSYIKTSWNELQRIEFNLPADLFRQKVRFTVSRSWCSCSPFRQVSISWSYAN